MESAVPETRSQVKVGDPTLNLIRYGAVLYRVTQTEFAGMVVNDFFRSNKQQVDELADAIANYPEDYPEVLDRIKSQ